MDEKHRVPFTEFNDVYLETGLLAGPASLQATLPSNLFGIVQSDCKLHQPYGVQYSLGEKIRCYLRYATISFVPL